MALTWAALASFTHTSLGVAAQVIALFPGDFIVGIGLGFAGLVSSLVAGLVAGVQLGLGHLFSALGFLLADILGVALQGVTFCLLAL